MGIAILIPTFMRGYASTEVVLLSVAYGMPFLATVALYVGILRRRMWGGWIATVFLGLFVLFHAVLAVVSALTMVRDPGGTLFTGSPGALGGALIGCVLYAIPHGLLFKARKRFQEVTAPTRAE